MKKHILHLLQLCENYTDYTICAIYADYLELQYLDKLKCIPMLDTSDVLVYHW